MASESLVLPSLGVIMEGRTLDREALERVETTLASAACPEAYLRAETTQENLLLLFFRSRAHLAARIDGATLRRSSLLEFFERAKAALHFRLCRADPGLILVLSILSQHQPSMKVPLGVADVSQILAKIAGKGTDAVLAIAAGGKRNLAFCRDGVPASVYFADPASAPTEESVKDRILVSCYDLPASEHATIEVFEDMAIERDSYAGRALTDYLDGTIGPPPFRLKVIHGHDVVDRRLFEKGEATVGRASSNDVVLDDLGVSRKHFIIQWRDECYWVKDFGTANGILLNGERVSEAEITFGDTITVGDFLVSFGRHQEPATREDLRTLLFAVPTGGKRAKLMYRDREFDLDRTVFTIGSSTRASLRLTGLRMQPIQATIIHDEGTRYRLKRTMRGRVVKVNGQKVGDEGRSLESGDQIAVGFHDVVFVVENR